MSVLVVTKKEFQDAIRSYTLAGLVIFFTILTGIWSAIHWIPEMSAPVSGNLDTIALLNSMRQPGLFLIPLVALVVGYRAIALERENGSIRLLLSLPHTRGDVLLGKIIGQTAVVSVSIICGYGVAALIAFFTYGSFSLPVFVAYTLLSILYGLVCISIAVSVSACTSSREWAIIGAGSVYLVFIFFWDAIVGVLNVVFVENPSQPAAHPDWLVILRYVNPSTAFAQATRATIPATREITTYPLLRATSWLDWYGLIVLSLWIAISVGISHLLFSRADLN